jgi:predicted dehydrogenase
VTKIRWGLIGAGWIANKAIAPAIHAASGAIVQAVASRDPERSRALKPVTVHESYQDLINNPLIDAVYISLPNHLHCQWSVAALNAGKHVLCEKPFAMNAAEVTLMTTAARQHNRLIVEAVSPLWHPRMARMIEYVRAGNIGRIISIDSSFTFPAEITANYRNSPAMGGGALFDVGVYQFHAIAAVVGDNAQLEIQSSDVTVGPTGIDLTSKWQVSIDGSITARGLASFEMPENQSLAVRGSEGSVELIGREVFTSWHTPSQLRLGDAVEEFEAVDAYRLMIENFGRKVQGQESWVLPLETSLFVHKAMDQLRETF